VKKKRQWTILKDPWGHRSKLRETNGLREGAHLEELGNQRDSLWGKKVREARIGWKHSIKGITVRNLKEGGKGEMLVHQYKKIKTKKKKSSCVVLKTLGGL